MITLLGICCNQWKPILEGIKEERAKIKQIHSRSDANAARKNLNRTWLGACCPSCEETGNLRIYDIYTHPVGQGLVPHSEPLSFLRLKCHSCQATHGVFPEDYIPFSSGSVIHHCLGVYSMPCQEDSVSDIPSQQSGSKGSNGAKTTPLLDRFRSILSSHGNIQDAIDDKKEGLFFCGEPLPKPILQRDKEEFPEVSISSLYDHKTRFEEYQAEAWMTLLSLGYVTIGTSLSRKEIIRQILIHPLADFLEAFSRMWSIPFLAPRGPFLKKRCKHGCFQLS